MKQTTRPEPAYYVGVVGIWLLITVLSVLFWSGVIVAAVWLLERQP